MSVVAGGGRAGHTPLMVPSSGWSSAFSSEGRRDMMVTGSSQSHWHFKCEMSRDCNERCRKTAAFFRLEIPSAF